MLIIQNTEQDGCNLMTYTMELNFYFAHPWNLTYDSHIIQFIFFILIHQLIKAWGHIYASVNLVAIASGHGSSPVQYQAII